MLNILQGYWSTVADGHDNISPIWLASVTTTGITAPAVVTPHYPNGNVFEYLRLHPNTDRFIIICQAASALAYIHSKGVVHGNICPVSVISVVQSYFCFMFDPDTDKLILKENVCIADDNMVRMTDVGVDTLIRQMIPHAIPPNWMYKSREELEHGIRTLPTDVYSFACTIFSVCVYLQGRDRSLINLARSII
jgi:serine/threonine protein kinase